MAEDKKPELKRVYNIPLRKEWLKAPKYKRAKKAVNTIKRFLVKHMKSENVKLGKKLNLKVWERGIKSPPHHVMINAIKDSENIVKAELVGFEYGEKAPEKVKKKKVEKKEEEKTEEKLETKVEEKVQEEKKVEEPKPVKPKKKGRKALQKELKEMKKKA